VWWFLVIIRRFVGPLLLFGFMSRLHPYTHTFHQRHVGAAPLGGFGYGLPNSICSLVHGVSHLGGYTRDVGMLGSGGACHRHIAIHRLCTGLRYHVALRVHYSRLNAIFRQAQPNSWSLLRSTCGCYGFQRISVPAPCRGVVYTHTSPLQVDVSRCDRRNQDYPIQTHKKGPQRAPLSIL
jgi:hypothetical protein